MSFLYTTLPYSSESKRQAIVNLLDNATPDRDFYILVIGAILLALAGIFTDSIPVLIASMLVAPLAYPILATGLGVVAGDIRLVLRSLGMLLIALLLAIGMAILLTNLLKGLRVENLFLSFGGSHFFAIAIAITSGAIAAYGLVRVKVGGAMTGIGIAVSLMPPLVATGVEIASRNYTLATNAFTIFVLNVAGILCASAIIFAVMGLRRTYHEVRVPQNKI